MDLKHLSEILRRAGAADPAVSGPARRAFAAALSGPVKEAIFPGDLFSDLFTVTKKDPKWDGRYETDLIQYGQERDFTAYFIPQHGRLPERVVEPDFFRVPVYRQGNHIEIPLRVIEQSDMDVLARALEILESGIVEKMNDDAWYCLIKACADRDVNVIDDTVNPGLVTKRLIRLLLIEFTRSAGNTSSVNAFRLGRLYMSLEAMASIVDLTNADLDDTTRRALTMSDNGVPESWYGVEMKSIVELGAGQRYQEYFDTTLAGDMPTYTLSGSKTKTELLVGVDLTKRNKLVMPVTAEPVVYEDTTYHRRDLASFYCRFEHGTAVLDNRVAMFGAA